MIKTFSVFLILTIICCKANHQSFRILSSEVPTLRPNLTIQNKSSAFFVPVDVAENAPKSYPMMLSLYSSETIFVNGIQGFANFNCELPDCSKASAEDMDISVPKYVLNGYRVQTSIFLNKDIWFFKQSDLYRPILANSLKSGTTGDFGNGFSGILGMGNAHNGRHVQTTFSIYLDKNDMGGNLIFGVDLNNVKSKDPVASWPVDENWHVNNIQAVNIETSTINATLDHKLIFDLNIDDIIFPVYFQEKIINAFKFDGILCELKDSRMQCNKISKDKEFPVIKIDVNGSSLPLSPELYVINYDAKANESLVMSTRLRFASPQSTNEYITHNFQHYIILGRCVMKEYYTAFHGFEKKIVVYTAGYELISDSQLHKILFIVAALILVLLCHKYCRKSKKSFDEVDISTKENPFGGKASYSRVN